jgi:MFS family permease
LFLIATVIDGVIFSAWSLFLNFYMLERGFDRQFLGMLTAANSVAALIFGVPLGALSDRIGRKPAMLLGVGLSIVALAFEVILLDPRLIVLMAFIAGIGNTLYYMSQAPFMMKVSTPDNRALLFSLNFGLVTLSSAVGSLFAGQLPAWFAGRLGVPADSAQAYQAVLLAAVLLGSLTLVPLAMIQEPGAKSAADRTGPPETARRPSIWKVLTRKLTIQISLPNLCIGLGAAILIPYMNIFFRDKFDISDQTLGILFSISALITGAGSLMAPRLAIKMGGKIKAVVITQAFSLLFLLVLGFAPQPWMAYTAFLMRGALMNMAVPLYSAFAMEQVHETEQATVNSVKELAWQFGWAVGPYFSGVVQQSYGFSPLFISTAFLYATAIFLTWRFFGKSESKASNPQAWTLSTQEQTND